MRKGQKHSEEHKKNISKGLKRWHKEVGFSEETKRKISVSNKGKHKGEGFQKGHKHSEETLLKISNSLKGRKAWNKGLTKETDERVRRNIEIAHTTKIKRGIYKRISENMKGEKNHLYGRHLSIEHRQKLSDSLKGKKLSDEHKKKISKKNKGHSVSEKTKRKISIAKKGKRVSQKTEFKSGKDNLNFNNYSSFLPYDKRFTDKFKRVIRKRDNYICMKCGKHQEKEKKALTIHHINYDKQMTIKENCCTLCHKCNSEVNYNRKHWTKFFQSLLSEKYDYKYSENGEIVVKLI